MSQRVSLEQFGAKLDVHHIKPAQAFDDPTARNAMENLVTLCRSCHKKWEGIPLRPEVIP
jgi:5-methylcytosine-specific restriction endonuclease McrA